MRSDRANKNSNAYRDETQTELDFLDGATAGSVVASKTLVYGSSGEVAATTLDVAGASSFLGVKKFQSFVGSFADIGDGSTQFADNDVLVELGTLDTEVPSGHVAASKFFIDKVLIGITTACGQTHVGNLNLSATSGTAANTGVSSGTEIVGAGVDSFSTHTSASSSTTEININWNNTAGNYHVFTPNITAPIAKKYLYACTETTLNADATDGRFTVHIEYTLF
jgi:hypothetical protein